MGMGTLIENKLQYTLITLNIIVLLSFLCSCNWYYPNHEYYKDLKIEILALTGVDTSQLKQVNSYDESIVSFHGEGLDVYEFDYSGDSNFQYVRLSQEDSTMLFSHQDEDISAISDSLLCEINEGKGGVLYCFPGEIAIIYTPEKIWLYDWNY